MDNFEKEDVKRGIDAHINKKQLFTPQLKSEIRKKALEKRNSIMNFNTSKKALITLFSSFLGVTIAGTLLFFLIGEPFSDRGEIDESTLGVNSASEPDPESVNGTLFVDTLNSTLQAAAALSTNDFETLQSVIVSSATINEKEQTVTFPVGETPFVFETKYFPPFDLKDLKIAGYDERKGVDPIIILRIEEHTYEVQFSKDKGSNDEYRIISFIGNR
ncbi:hypothetical protein [Lysinibacillus sp. 54212]|uniref:hypothetical protein n=1 Tax=Lysinibacillus sp. 54212 TaxID=3119829 RepID=UPI002FCB9811